MDEALSAVIQTYNRKDLSNSDEKRAENRVIRQAEAIERYENGESITES